ncbi:zinc-dependent metalloprotease [Parapedobacter sp. 2B3]|uniref:zinc-dependent metalloprotease n=1 Tax=Parapedobacter sp. 2B3 TaxID=3342381 RepID=UPI0035B69AAA
MNLKLTVSSLGFALAVFVFYCSMLSPVQGFGQTDTVKSRVDTIRADTAAADSAKKKKPEAKGPKPYAEVIKPEAKSQKGLIYVHELDDKYFFEVGDSVLGRDMLLVTRLAKAGANMRSGMSGYAGDPVNQAVIRFEKGAKHKLFIRKVSFSEYSKDSTQSMYQAVTRSNLQPIAASFDIAAFSPDSTGSVVDVTKFLEGDNDLLFFGSADIKKALKLGGYQSDKSYTEGVTTYPMNTEIKTVKTYARSEGGTATVELNTSIVKLPENPMQPRYADNRVGYFTVGYTDFDKDPQGVEQVRLVKRWRLVPKDWAAYRRGELVEPVKPIVFYIDPATPKKWVPYLIQGVNDWQAAFEKAGFKNAIYALEAPTKAQDSTWSLDDARYSAIVYKASSVPNASGPSIADPRTGEIMESHINWYHNVMRLLRNWYFIQAAPNDKGAQRLAFSDELMGQLIRFVSSHEVGHTLGLRHNFGSSSSTPVEKLRDKKWVEAHGHTPSIMDYARFNYVAQPEDNISEKGLFPRIGDYDTWAIEWGYRLFPQFENADAEQGHLNKWVIDKNKDRRLWFGHESNPSDPRSQSEDMGDNAMLASTYGIRNLKRVVENLPGWTETENEGYSGLAELYREVNTQFGRYIGHVIKNIGGVYETPKTVEQRGAVYSAVPKTIQKEALAFLETQVLHTPEWLIVPEIYERIGGSPLSTVGAHQLRVVNNLFDTDRLQRLVEAEVAAGDPEEAYGILEYFKDVHAMVWRDLDGTEAADVYRRNLQKSYIAKLAELASPKPVATAASVPSGVVVRVVRNGNDLAHSDIRSLAKYQLRNLKSALEASIPAISDVMTKIHVQDCLDRVEEALKLDD